jgi:hypothetical protein
MLSRRVRGRYVVGLCVLAVVLGAGRAAAQGELGNKDTLYNEFSNNRIDFDKLLRGEATYKPADKTISETAARWAIYPFTWLKTYRKGEIKSPQSLHTEFQTRMKLAGEQSPKNRAFMDVFAKDLVEALKQAMASRKLDEHRQQIANLALLLPELAQCKNDHVGDFLAGLLNDPKQHPLFRMYAARGLREFFPVFQVTGREENPGAKDFQEKRARALQRVDAVLAYVFQKWEFTPDVKEQLDAVLFQRREGVRTLAQAEALAVEFEKNTDGMLSKVNGPVAVGLMRILQKGTLTPPATLAERTEAAIGVCKLRGPNNKPIDNEAYRSDLAVALVGQLLLDFTEQYVVDYSASISTKKIPVLPWRVYAERLKDALKDFQTNSPRGTAQQKKAYEQIKELIAKAEPLLDTIKTLRAIEAPADLRDFVATLQPGTTTVFEGVPATNLKGGKGG